MFQEKHQKQLLNFLILKRERYTNVRLVVKVLTLAKVDIILSFSNYQGTYNTFLCGIFILFKLITLITWISSTIFFLSPFSFLQVVNIKGDNPDAIVPGLMAAGEAACAVCQCER